MPILPTLEEISRLPKQIARDVLSCVDTYSQSNPLLIDPNAMERHHGFPKKLLEYFLDSGVNIEKFIIIMRAADHRLKPDGLHTGKRRGGDWNTEWDEFIKTNPPQNTEAHREKIQEKLEEMKKKYGIQ